MADTSNRNGGVATPAAPSRPASDPPSPPCQRPAILVGAVPRELPGSRPGDAVAKTETGASRIAGTGSAASTAAHDARILVAITVHFNAARLHYLAEVLRSLAEYPVAAMHVILVTNTVRDDELTVLRGLCDEILVGKTASVRSYEYPGASALFDLAASQIHRPGSRRP